jgi:WD40 repeat protein
MTEPPMCCWSGRGVVSSSVACALLLGCAGSRPSGDRAASGVATSAAVDGGAAPVARPSFDGAPFSSAPPVGSTASTPIPAAAAFAPYVFDGLHSIPENIVASPDGRWFAVVSRQPHTGLLLFDRASSMPKAALPTYGRDGASFSHDGARILSALNREIGIWDTATGEQVAHLRWPRERSRRCFSCPVVWAADGRRVATLERRNRVLIWALPNEEVSRQCDVGETVEAMAFEAGGTRLVLALDRGVAELDTESCAKTPLTALSLGRAAVFSGDGGTLARWVDRAIELFDVAQRQQLQPIRDRIPAVKVVSPGKEIGTESPPQITLAHDGRTLMLLDASRKPRFWDTRSRQRLSLGEGPALPAGSGDAELCARSFQQGASPTVLAAALSDRSLFVAFPDVIPRFAFSGVLCVVQTEPNAVVRTIGASRSIASTFAISPDGAHLALRRQGTSSLVGPMGRDDLHLPNAQWLAWAPDGHRLSALDGQSHTLTSVDARTGAVLLRVVQVGEPAVALADWGHTVAVLTEQALVSFDDNAPPRVQRLPETARWGSVAASADRFAYVDTDWQLHIRSARALQHVVAPRPVATGVLALSDAGGRAAVIFRDQLHILDAATGADLCTVTPRFSLAAVAFSRDEQRVVSVDEDGWVTTREVGSCATVGEFGARDGELSSRSLPGQVAFVGKDSIAYLEKDGTLQIVTSAGEVRLTLHPSTGNTAVAVDPSGRFEAFGRGIDLVRCRRNGSAAIDPLESCRTQLEQPGLLRSVAGQR